MPPIPSDLFNDLRQVLLDCGPFDNNSQLRAFFGYPTLKPWQNRLHDADSIQNRADYTIDFLQNQFTSAGDNVLILFLETLRDRTPTEDACYDRLSELIEAFSETFQSEPAGRGATSSIDTRLARKRGWRKSAVPLGPIKQRWALLVGINQYVDDSFRPLRFCVNDVLVMEEELKKLGYVVVTLHDETHEPRLQPDNDNIEAELARLCQVAQPDDLLWVHFACHGQVQEGEPILITKRTRQATLTRSGLPLAQVEAQMRDSKAHRLVLTLDACHVGVDIGRGSSDPAFIRHAHDLAEGFALIAASTSQQQAHEWREKEHGVFTYYLLEALTGQAARNDNQFVTVDDLKTYVLHHLRLWSIEHNSLIQEPSARTDGLGDMILADFREIEN